MTAINPGLLLMLGALPVPLLPVLLRRVYMLLLPAVVLAYLVQLEPGVYGQIPFLGATLEVNRVDKLSKLFGYVFFLMAFLGIVYALHQNDRVQETAALAYIGSAIGAVFAGDMITLFVFWEITAISSVFLIWARGTERAYRAGMRYLIIQVGSGVILLTGVLVMVAETGSAAFGHIGVDSTWGKLILLAFGIKAAFPFLHNWVQDSYPEATVTGTVILSAFTTKLAIYALARGFAGTEILITIGAVMTVFPIFYALIENDLRRVLAYSLNIQLGFMVVGIGVGTELALNGAVAHAVVHILYKALLFMSMGAVLFRTGTIKATELGGLYKSMPFTTSFCIVGALSISAFPLFSGFITKSMILAALGEEGHWFAKATLLVASAGVLHYTGIRVPYFAFFARDSGKRVPEAPFNMLLAMGVMAALCIGIGVYPAPLYALLPFPVDYEAYTTAHVLTQLQLLLFSALAFAVLILTGLYPPEKRSTNLDVDWLYRKLGARLLTVIADWAFAWMAIGHDAAKRGIGSIWNWVGVYLGPSGLIGRTHNAGSMVMWVIFLLGAYLLIYFIA